MRFKQHPVIRFFNGLITYLLFGLIGVSLALLLVRQQYLREGPLELEKKVVSIAKGWGVRQIADHLEKEHIISDRLIFIASAKFNGATLKAGDYDFSKHASMKDVLERLSKGDAITYSITFPEGLTSHQIVQRLNAHPNLKGKIQIREIPDEGTLMPDTYKYAPGTARKDILVQMSQKQKEFIDKNWPDRVPDLPFKDKKQAVILASIVEKETGSVDERPRVASVFINRLNKGMRLQSDPTIIYGLSNKTGSLGRPIRRSDIKQNTPYNTYRNYKLPPGPICNPGRAALEAVLHPANTKDLYFVADGTGGHAFSPTLAEHNKKVAEWRKIEKRLREAREAKAKAEAEAEKEAKDKDKKAKTAKDGGAKKEVGNKKTKNSVTREENGKKTNAVAVPGVNVTGTAKTTTR
jgi:UPF0755 protein